MDIARTRLNPARVSSCFSDESFLGYLKKIGVRCHSSNMMLRLLQRYILFLSLRWKDSRTKWMGSFVHATRPTAQWKIVSGASWVSHRMPMHCYRVVSLDVLWFLLGYWTLAPGIQSGKCKPLQIRTVWCTCAIVGFRWIHWMVSRWASWSIFESSWKNSAVADALSSSGLSFIKPVFFRFRVIFFPGVAHMVVFQNLVPSNKGYKNGIMMDLHVNIGCGRNPVCEIIRWTYGMPRRIDGIIQTIWSWRNRRDMWKWGISWVTGNKYWD